ncbi:MAG TPA: FG-GAP-like repeat-containing protein, partial [Planctomycetota bacterium]|nr:FG-GAP-like repeat-containing protein [Planctomycetota bacterium]
MAILLSCCAGIVEARQASPARGPDRGLDPKFRARLSLVDAAKDSDWPTETWAQSIGARLDEIAARWAASELETALADASWIAPQLRVPPLFRPFPASDAGPEVWRAQRGLSASGDSQSTAPISSALGAWRKVFHGQSRLDFELIGIEGGASRLSSRIRVSAGGPVERGREQHNATWTCTWRIDESGAALLDLRVETFEAVALGPGEAGQFVDITESLFEDPALYGARLAPGLEHWRRSIPASLDPGALGHHGIALGDVDGDGLEDIYWCRPGGLPNQLFLHTKEHRLIDASASAGVDLLDYSSSALVADLDGDGDLDLVVSTGAGLVFFANDGSAHFERKTLIERSLATSMAGADFDTDGDLDLYVGSYLSPFEKNGLPVPYHDANNGEENLLLRNDGDWKFVDVCAAVGLGENNRRFTLAVAWEDFDNDGDQDLGVANDFGRKNLYRNDGGRFRDVAAELAAEDISAGMGIDWADVDHDGWMDLYATNMHTPAAGRLTSQPEFRRGSSPATMQAYRDHAQGNTLLLNRGGKSFHDAAASSGTAFGRWGWGSIFVDFDNDGAPDIFAPNGFVSGERDGDLDSFFWRQVVLRSPEQAGEPGESYSEGWRAVNRLMRQGYSWNGHERNVAFWNRGEARFADVSSAIGLEHADDSRAAVRIDWEGDGDEDLIVTNRSGPMLRVLENRQATGNGWIAFELRGSDARRTAIGARVVLEASDGRRHLRTLHCGQGYLAQSTSRLHFGLGRASVKQLSVRWPGGETEEFDIPVPGAVYALVQGTGTPRPITLPPARVAARESARTSMPAELSARTVLPIPLALPRLLLETSDGKPASILGITMQGPQGTGQPLVLMLWSVADESSRAELRRVGAAAEALRAAGIQQFIALSLDADEAARARAVVAWKESSWPFARAFVSEESARVLELVQAALHDDARGLVLPTTFLIDTSGKLVSTYSGPVDPGQLQEDLGLFALGPEARRDACAPFPGRWISKSAESLDKEVAARLRAHGLERPAGEYELVKLDVRQASAASIEFELAVARYGQKRFVEAARHFERALAADPRHVRAAQGLATTYHQLGDFPAALAAYKAALQ